MRWYFKLTIYLFVVIFVLLLIKMVVDGFLSKLSQSSSYGGFLLFFVLGLFMVKDVVVSVSGDSKSKVLSCVFWKDVLCSFRKDGKSRVMERCATCEEYKRFMNMMGDEDERLMNEIDEIRRTGVWR